MGLFIKIGNRSVKPERIIWRYIDLYKLIDLLDSSELYFAKINMQEDKKEGTIRVVDLSEGYDIINRKFKFQKSSIEDLNNYFINCWNNDKIETNSLWKLYLKEEGVAICSSKDWLKDQLKGITDFIDNVHYANLHKEAIQCYDNQNIRYFCKDISFEHEKEFRALIDKNKLNKEDERVKLVINKKNELIGVKIKIDLKELIGNIYVPPNFNKWKKNMIKDLVSKYGIDTDVVRESRINYRLYNKNI